MPFRQSPPPQSVLQSLLWPEPETTGPETDLYFRQGEGARLAFSDPRRVLMTAGAQIGLDTAFNLFPLGKWRQHCDLSDLQLRVRGRGEIRIEVMQTLQGQPERQLLCAELALQVDSDGSCDLAAAFDTAEGGVLSVTLTALSATELHGVDWLSQHQPCRSPDLVLVITTFNREAQVRAAIARLETFIAESPIGDHLHLVVVDNGQSLGALASAGVTVIANENLGGAGGFARGLIAARQRGASHCIFMDDDAAIPMAAISRTYAFLAHASDPATAVAASLASARKPWVLWESGAVFDGLCRPLHNGTDLRRFDQVAAMELAQIGAPTAGFYGGWWFFAFPLDAVRHAPFPFFVRGDDVSFSLANPFRIVLLPGVVSRQEADFPEKESVQTIYLETRSHLAHQLALTELRNGRMWLLRTPLHFAARGLLCCRYARISAVRLAVCDVMQGPDFFAADADMASRRPLLRELSAPEAWVPTTAPPPAERLRLANCGKAMRIVLALSLNGHLLPFFRHWGDRAVLTPEESTSIAAFRGVAQAHVRDEAGRGFVLRHSKWTALREGLRLAAVMLTLVWRYRALCRDWQQGYARIASESFWQRRFAQGDRSGEQ